MDSGDVSDASPPRRARPTNRTSFNRSTRPHSTPHTHGDVSDASPPRRRRRRHSDLTPLPELPHAKRRSSRVRAFDDASYSHYDDDNINHKNALSRGHAYSSHRNDFSIVSQRSQRKKQQYATPEHSKDDLRDERASFPKHAPHLSNATTRRRLSFERYRNDSSREDDVQSVRSVPHYVSEGQDSHLNGYNSQLETPKWHTIPPNRFGIKPGPRWDGVNRSNGFEQRLEEASARRKDMKLQAYKASVSDM